MAHFAELDNNNIIQQVIVVNNDDISNLPFPESEPVGIAFLETLLPGKKWAQISFNGSFRVRYAGVGDVFYPNCTATPYGGFGNPKPYDNWVFDEATCWWIPPLPYPDDGKNYYWEQEANSWVLAKMQPSVPVTIIGE